MIDISGAAAAPLLVALAARSAWWGHVPGPAGRPGGYPVRLDPGAGGLDLDLPAGLTEEAAIRWNSAHEEVSGLTIATDGSVSYTGRLYEELAKVSPDLARGFHVRDLEAVEAAMKGLRQSLLSTEVFDDG